MNKGGACQCRICSLDTTCCRVHPLICPPLVLYQRCTCDYFVVIPIVQLEHGPYLEVTDSMGWGRGMSEWGWDMGMGHGDGTP